MTPLSDDIEATAVLKQYMAKLRDLGWEALWDDYADRGTALVCGVRVGREPDERVEEVEMPSGRRYQLRSWASSSDEQRLHILIFLNEDDSVDDELGDSMILTPADFERA